MRRAAAILLVLCGLIGLCSLTTYADSALFTVEFVPRTENGTVFYLDVCSEEAIGAAVFELSFDDGAVEYRDISGNGTASVQAVEQDGGLRIAYGSPTGGSGALLRLTFKALTNAEAQFTLHTEQAVDADIRYLTDVPDYYLSADVGRQKVIKSGTVKTTGNKKSSTDKQEKSSKTSSGRSTKSGSAEQDDDAVNPGPGSQSVSNRESERWFVIGVCAGAGVLLTAALAFIIGRRVGIRKKPHEANEPEPESVTDDNNSDTE